jgi:hypothetical protein
MSTNTQLSSAELVSRILADPTFANEIIDYVTRIKPRLATLASKTHVLEMVQVAHEEKIKEYKKLLKKLHGKYQTLAAEKSTQADKLTCPECDGCAVKAQTIEKLKKDLEETKKCDQAKQELQDIKCKICETKDKLINNLETQLVSTKQLIQTQQSSQLTQCKSCEEKNGFIKDLTGQIGKPCSRCVAKDETINKLIKTSSKQSKEKDNSIKRLGALVKQMENENIEKEEQISNLNKMIREELDRQKVVLAQSKTTVSQTQDEQSTSAPSVMNELYKQFENFLNQSK